MSALLAEDLAATIPATLPSVGTRPRRWRHVERGPVSRPQLVALPGGRPCGVAAPGVRSVGAPAAAARPSASSWQLTDRGIAVVVLFFLALVATAAVVLVGSFLAVSDAPVVAPHDVAAVALRA